MLKQAAILEVVKEDRVYTMVLPNNAPLGELHDVIFQMRSFVVDKINDSINAEKPKEPVEIQEIPKEE
jgi:hypothetical protein